MLFLKCVENTQIFSGDPSGTKGIFVFVIIAKQKMENWTKHHVQWSASFHTFT